MGMPSTAGGASGLLLLLDESTGPWRVPLGGLEEPDDIVVGVLHGGDQLAPADVLDTLLRLRAGVEERPETLLDVVYVPVAHRSRHPLGVAVRIEAHVLTPDAEADVIGLVHVGLDAQQLPVQRLGLAKVPHGLHDRLDAFGHGCVPSVARVTSTGLGPSLLQ